MSAAENKALVRQYFEAFHNERQLDLGERIFGSELLAPTLDVAAMMRTAFPDHRITIDDQLADVERGHRQQRAHERAVRRGVAVAPRRRDRQADDHDPQRLLA